MTTAGLALAPMDRSARLDRVRAAMDGADCQALVVTKPVNIRWLTGFTGSAGTLVIGPDRLLLITDDRYQTQVAEQLTASEVAAEVAITRDPAEPVRAGVAAAEAIGLESEHVTWADLKQFEDWLPGRRLQPTVGMIEAERRTKDPGELDRLQAAAAIADAALAAVVADLHEGPTELELARRLERAMLDGGADGLSFPTIVAAGPNSAKPHARPSERVISEGDMVVIDFGAAVDGYGSDMTRSFLIGETSDESRRIYDAVVEAQAAGVATVAGGVTEREVDQACRDRLADHGLAEAFVHGTGHGLGLEIHEKPFLSTRSTGILRTGYVVTVEPGVYLPEIGGIRIEDSVVVTDSGCEALTKSPKDPQPAIR